MKLAISILLLALFISNGYWAYLVIDSGISYTYLNSSFELSEKSLSQALIVANENVIGLSLTEAQQIFTKDVYGGEPFIKDGCFHVGTVCLELGENNEIIGVAAGAQ